MLKFDGNKAQYKDPQSSHDLLERMSPRFLDLPK